MMLCCFVSKLAAAQTYSAPGMPLHLQRSVPPAARALAGKPTEEAAGITSPRFWKLKDSAFVKAAAPFYQYVGSQFRWPVTTFRAGIEGRIVVRLVVLPTGVVERAEVVRRELKQAEGYSKEEGLDRGTAALETEDVRFIRQLRFEPAVTVDTIAVPLTRRMQ